MNRASGLPAQVVSNVGGEVLRYPQAALVPMAAVWTPKIEVLRIGLIISLGLLIPVMVAQAAVPRLLVVTVEAKAVEMATHETEILDQVVLKLLVGLL